MKRKKQKYAGFTLVEMLIVLLVIAVLVFLFVPNLTGQREKINAKGDDAFRKVVVTQVELYTQHEDESIAGNQLSLENLVKKKYLSAEQKKRAEKLGITDETLRE
ncbi:prepilin-type N-terminal cleavage/methylation domain-containing protein [Vagococcus sp. BWB3-3]|uniref:Prepilin-type N-terminal cleavage/methylation domain-containing protein n=1 Tax=Vagococcus allomyrinae TaxID=2794353 RepID=A0A940PIH8_9ENTE|nr:competence type IV pilus major pilin ComGC [Vagococcus allomyrinae]MBP1043523.1 prepilin-type N-terminal cleavage/methylation domain-containing protein [Vagococcus allomyrinae]